MPRAKAVPYRDLQDIYDAHQVVGVFALFSGGHDSLAAAHVASQMPGFAGLIHVDTTTGLKETRQFVNETAAAHGWPLYVGRPYIGYESLIVKSGFPGPAMHQIMYDRLKDRTLRQILKEIKAKSPLAKVKRARFVLVSGVRQQESDRRAEILTGIHEEESRIWLPAIVDMTATDVTHYIRDHGLKRSPVKDKIHMSGECFCGAFSRPGELQELEYWFPYQAQRIKYWQGLTIKAAELKDWEVKEGLRPADETISPRHCGWGWKDGLPLGQMSFQMCFHCRSNGEQ